MTGKHVKKKNKQVELNQGKKEKNWKGNNEWKR